MKKNIMICFITLSLAACASRHPGNKAINIETEIQTPLILSAMTIESPRYKGFQLIEVSIENKSNLWVHINQAKVVIQPPMDSILSVVLGSQLKYWAEAMENQIKIDKHNSEIMQSTLLTLGVATTTNQRNSDNTTSALIGTTLIAGTTLWAVIDTLNHNKNIAETNRKTPENHLYTEFSVPPGMFLRRWVLINKPTDKRIDKLVLEINTDNKKGLYQIQM